ncbi:low molecular weight protein arginine phosphatase [Methanobrevibacter sp.]|uniref:low molecular weight protein arginine phosphatase n=1 Tax=Methanobrevibacter sp. TaxID=66852 RepID=UPI00388ED019
MKILFVCTGNTCRSPMAEAIFKDIADLSKFQVSSAGLLAFPGDSASNKAVIVCDNHGIDLTHHRSRPLDQSQIETADLVLTAEESHREKIRMLYPHVSVYTIKQYSGDYENPDISDPISGDLKTYEDCFLEIKEALEKILLENKL